MGKDSKELDMRDSIIDAEISMIFSTFGDNLFTCTGDELKELRYEANDFEEVYKVNIQRLSEGEDETSKEFKNLLNTIILNYYLMLEFTSEYLNVQDNTVKGKTFREVWDTITIKDKALVIETSIVLEDTKALVSGMYLLLAQHDMV